MMNRQILFVDDDKNVLNGLKRMLRSMRDSWDMEFAESGMEALKILETKPFDVVVSDMRMPGMDGAQLLTKVKMLYPKTVRLILSGQSQQESIIRSIGPSHQFLSKPCNAETLRDTVSRACALMDCLNGSNIKNLMSQMTTLPSLPSLYVELLELLKSPEASIKQVGNIISKDIGMTAKVLQLVNSAYFGIPRRINSASEGVSLLGLDLIKSLAFSVQVFSQFDQDRLPGFSIEQLWHHSMGTAVFSRKIAWHEKQDSELADNAFMAGMLHDVGKLIMAYNIPEEYSKTIQIAKETCVPHWQAEKEVFGTSHDEVGAYLLTLWGIPNTIVEPVMFHHRPLESHDKMFTNVTAVHTADSLYMSNIIHVANLFDHQGNPIDVIGASYDADKEYLETIGVSDKYEVWRDICLTEDKEEANNE